MKTHACAAEGCQHTVPAFHLMCAEHWPMVPKAVRDAMARHRAAAKRTGRQPLAPDSLRAEAVAAVRDKQICRAERQAGGTPTLF